MKIPANRFVFWWRLSIIKTRGQYLGLFCVALVCGWLIGVCIGMAVATKVINAHHSNLPYRPDLYDYGQEQTNPRP